MATKLIELGDGIFVEVEVPDGQAQPISSQFAKRLGTTFDQIIFDNIKPILVKTCRPIVAAWKEVNQDMQIEQAEVEIGFSFEGEGNIYLTKAKAASNIKVKLVLKPKD